jgi:hypothetical protein
MALPATNTDFSPLQIPPLPQISYFLDNQTHCSISVGRVKLTLNENFQPSHQTQLTFTDCSLPHLSFDLSRALVVIFLAAGRNNDTCLAYCLVRLVTALAHLFPIDGTGPQDNGTIQYKKLLNTDRPGEFRP